MSSRWNRYLDYEAALVTAGLIEKRKEKPKKKREKGPKRRLTNFNELVHDEPTDVALDLSSVVKETEAAIKALDVHGDVEELHPFFNPWLRANLGALCGWNLYHGPAAMKGVLKHIDNMGVLLGRWYVSTTVTLAKGLTYNTLDNESLKNWALEQAPPEHNWDNRAFRYRNHCGEIFRRLNEVAATEGVYTQMLEENEVRLWIPLADVTSNSTFSWLLHSLRKQPTEHRLLDPVVTLHDNNGEYDESIELVCAFVHVDPRGPCGAANSMGIDPRGRFYKSKRERDDAESKRKAEMIRKLW